MTCRLRICRYHFCLRVSSFTGSQALAQLHQKLPIRRYPYWVLILETSIIVLNSAQTTSTKLRPYARSRTSAERPGKSGMQPPALHALLQTVLDVATSEKL